MAVHAPTAPRRREGVGAAVLLAPALIWIMVAVLAPLGMIVWVGFWRLEAFSLVRGFDSTTWQRVWGDPSFRSLVWWTLQVLGMVLVIVCVLGTTAGYFLARFVTSRRMQMLLLLLAILPFWTSYVIRIITWQPLFGNRGVLNYVLLQTGLTDEPLGIFLYTSRSMIFAMASLYVVFVIGPVFWSLSRVDPDVIEAARSLGASPWRTFWTVEFPLAKGGIVAGAFFAAIFLFGDFATERIIGGGTSPMLAGVINQYAGSIQWPTASVLATTLVVVALVILGLLMKIHDLRREL